MPIRVVRIGLRGIAGLNFAWALMNSFERTSLAYVRFALWARLGDADAYYILASTVGLVLLLLIEVVASRHARRAGPAQDKRPSAYASIVIDAVLVLGWAVLLYVEVATHIAWI